MSRAKQKGKAPVDPPLPPPLDNDDTTTGSNDHDDDDDDDDAILRLATVGKQHSGRLAGTTKDDEGDSSTAHTQLAKQHKPQTAAEKKKAAAQEEWADKLAAKQGRRLAGNVEKGKVITVKQERQRSMKQAEENSGVASALQQLAQKKKQKEKLKKMRKQQRKQSEDDEEDGEEEDEEESGEEEAGSEDGEEDEEEDEEVEREREQDEEADVEKVHYETLDEEIAAYRDQHTIAITTSLLPSAATASTSAQLHSDPLYYPLRSFADLQTQFSLPLRLTTALISPHFTQPTPIQAQVWPLILAGKDVVGVASTGSGKTLGFLLGALVYMCKKRGYLHKLDDTHFTPPTHTLSSPSPPTPLVLILSPTRELALQTFQIAQQACSSLGLTAMSLVGGPSIDGQLSLLQSSPPDIVVATPGRLTKHLAASSLSLGSCGYVVLDEADRMLDLGFHDAIMAILATLPAVHQTLLFSATWPPSISDVAMSVMRKEKVMKVNVGSDDLTAAKSVTQYVEVVDRRNGGRERRLLELLAEHPPSAQSLLLIFCLYKRESQQLSDYLNRHQHPALPLNSSFSHSQRTQTLASFRAGNPPILVATDVAARGLDINNIGTVVCFSVGLGVEAWVHRVGRCGRGGQKGTAYTFVVDWDVVHAAGLVRLLNESGSRVSDELREMAQRGQRRADKHREEAGLTGERLIVARLKKGGREREQEEEDEDVEERIFGKEQSAGTSFVQHGKKQHSQADGKKHGRAGGGRRGGRS